MTRKCNLVKWMLGLVATTAIFPAVASAQSVVDGSAVAGSEVATQATDDDAGFQLDEIIVTAQRYAQRLQDVPLSISVMTSDELKSRSVSTLDELQYSIPGLSTYEYGVGQQFIQLRGISNTLGSSTVGLYLDETPLILDRQGNALGIRLLDLERVEVLRGPQATLYGEGSMGGTLRYIPAAPKLDAIGGSVDGEYSSTKDGGDGYKITGVLNLPLVTDRLGLRMVAGHERVGGFIDSLATGKKDVNVADVTTLRGTLLATPNDRLDVSVMGLYQETDQEYQEFGVNRKTSAIVPTFNKDRYILGQVKGSYDFDFAELNGSASYIDRDNTVQADVSPFFVPFLPLFGVPAGVVTQVGLPVDYDYRVFSAELRLSSQNQGVFGWSIGTTYRNLKLDLLSESETAPGSLAFVINATDQKIATESFAIYGDASYELTSELKATVGLRYYEERRVQDTRSTSFGVTSVDSNKGTFASLNPRFNLSYNFSRNSIVYANVAKGFRGGGFNLTSSGGGIYTIPPSYEPDKIWTYEVGTKHQMFDNRLILDGGVYYSDWSDVQSYSFAPGGVIPIIVNGGQVTGWGAELSVSLRPTSDLTFTATYGWNNLEYAEAGEDKIKGDPVDGAVRESYSVSLDYRPSISDDITGMPRIDYQHAGSAQITLRNFGQIIARPSRDLVNVRVGADFGKFEVAVFVNNLFDEDAPNIIGPFGVFAEDLEQRPRVIGVNARASF
ncbi:MAG: TonB-dependent receptor [Emcibacter sp.]|nr:TonB-dependent receptor [Emcibacter sp.]